MMKKHRIFTCAVILIFIAIFTAVLSCSNFSIPESVEIKTGARYALDIGFDILDMSEYLSPKTIQNTVGTSFNVYDYNPGGTSPIKHFLVEYPAINQSIDISKHFENLDFGADANNSMGFDETFKVESIDMHPKFGPLKAGNGMPAEYSLDDPTNPVKLTIGTLGDADLSSAKIKNGSVILSVKQPAAWDSGLRLSLDGGSLSGGIDKSSALTPAFTSESKSGFLLYERCDLSGCDFKPAPVELGGKIKVNGTSNSTFDFDLQIDIVVTEYESVTVDIGKVKTTFDFQRDLPSELSNFVKEIECNEVGVKFNYKNNLPATSGGSGTNNNDIKLEMTSKFLKLTDPKTAKLENDGTSHELHIKPDGAQTLDLSQSSTKIDIKVELKLPGSTTASNGDTLITVHNVVVGQTYSLSISDFQLVLDWTAITVKTDKLSAQGENPLGIDFNSMFNAIKNSVGALSDLVNALQIGDIPVYMYVSKPANAFNDLNINVSELKILENNNETNLLDNKTISMTTKPLPGLEKGKILKTDLSTLDYLTPLKKEAFKYIINGKKDNLKLKYNIAPTSGSSSNELTINKSDVDNMKKNGSSLDIKAAVYIDIPLKLTLGSNVEIDLMKMAGMDAAGTDLMGRSEPLSFGEAEKYMDAVKSVELMMSLQNSVFVDAPSGKINFVIDDSGNGNGKNILGKKEYPLSNLKIDLTYDEVKKVLKSAPPYMPTIKINFPKDSGFQLPQSSAKFGFSGKVAVTTDGSIIIGEGK